MNKNLGEYKKYNNDSEVKLINNKRASTILFEKIMSEGYNILTLNSANEKLSSYYKKNTILYIIQKFVNYLQRKLIKKQKVFYIWIYNKVLEIYLKILI